MSQQYLLPCSCGQKTRVAPAQAGGQVSCPCGQSLTVPTLRGLRSLEEAPAEGPTRAAPRWSGVHGVVFVAALLVVAAGLATAGYHALGYADAVRFTADGTQKIIADLDAEDPLDKKTPVEALDLWKNQVLTGLHQEVEPIWIVARKSARKHWGWIVRGGCLAAGGLMAAVATLFVGRESKPA